MNKNHVKNMPKVINLGCRLNFESEIIKDILVENLDNCS